MAEQKLDHVDYDSLDAAKNAFIAASRKTLDFAKPYGFLPDASLGSSANVFSFDLQPFLKDGAGELSMTLLPEGLGTADDARPSDLTSEELTTFWHNIAFKTMSCLTNDAASSGMQTILVSLYLPSSTPETVFTKEFMSGFLDGFVEACRIVGCVYFSGETPQLKGKIVEGKLDVAGALVGVVPPGLQPIGTSQLGEGDSIILVESAGVHENGFTGFRELATKLPEGYRTKLPNGEEYWAELNAPSKLYTPLVQSVLCAGIQPSNIEPITGHGWQKLMRPSKALRYRITEMLPVPPIFAFIQEQTGADATEMLSKFNYGAGLAIFTKSADEAEQVVKLAVERDLKAVVAGQVEAADNREVVVEPLGVTLHGDSFMLAK